ncbi:MAG: putative MPP superfamily phosphohydrolase [Acidimicrobiales bacterium]
MTFNLFTIVAAVVAGALAGAAGARGAKERPVAALVEAAAVGLVSSIASVLTGIGLVGLDRFATMHVIYLNLTVGIPLAAVIIWSTVPDNRRLRMLLLLPALAAPVGLYASYIEPFWLRTDRVTVATDAFGPEWSALGRPVRIGVLADLQTTAIGDYENDAIDQLLAAAPDIVLIPGDFSQLHADEVDARVPEFAAVFQRLDTEVEHVVAVNGNTDGVDLLRRMAEGTNIIVLDNEIVELVVAGQPMRLAGITLFGDESRAQTAVADLASSEPGSFRLMLAHQPDEIGRLEANASVDLIVAGHTHGGQIALPFLPPPVTFSSVPRSVAAGGLSEMDGQAIYVSTGVGRERQRAPQIRFGVRPSIGVIELVSP